MAARAHEGARPAERAPSAIGSLGPRPASKSPAPRPALLLGAGYRIVPGEPLPAIPAGLQRDRTIRSHGDDPHSAWLVQFADGSPEDARRRIEAAGGTLVAHVPARAFLVRLTESGRAALASQADAPWLGDWQPAYKLSPRLDLKQPARDTLLAQVFGDADTDRLERDLRAIGATEVALHESQANRLASFVLERGRLASVASLEALCWIEPYPRARPFNADAQWVAQTGVSQSRRVWDQGLRGQGQVVMTSDSGVRPDHDMFRDSTLAITGFGHYPSHRKIIAYLPGAADPAIAFGDEANASYHGTHTAGTVLGNNDPYDSLAWDGIAKDAKLFFMDLSGPYSYGGVLPPPDLNDLFLPSYLGNAGGAARISSNSWGSGVGGAYTLSSMQVDQFMWSHPDYLIAFADGNGFYPGSVGSPATAKNCLSVGATGNGADADSLWTYTSRGPTSDLRRKPTLCAPGAALVSSVGNTRWAYAAREGTSMATPVVAGGMALMRQYLTEGWYPAGTPVPANAFEPSAALLKAMAINSGADDVRGHRTPDDDIGWGRLTLDDVLYFPGDARRLLLLEHPSGLHDRQYVEYEVQVTDPAQPLEVSLCWTDAPGSPAAAVQIVNDLDLSVWRGPERYLGNVYSEGHSVEGGLRDSLNVEEAVRVAQPLAGTWTIRVEGRDIGQGPQPFALCITGGVGDGTGTVAFDRADYALADTVRVELVDTGASGPVQVTITSTTELGGEEMTLEGSNGRFVGAIAVAPTSPASGDGALSVSIGDAIQLSYSGSTPAATVRAQATVSGWLPTITDVRARPLTPHSTLVTWSTDQPATSRVRYASSGPLVNLVGSAGYTTRHAVHLTGLEPGRRYSYDVESVSALGASSRDSLGGAHRTFTVKQPSALALVLGDPAMPELHAWTTVLDSLGLDYDLLTGPEIAPPLVGDGTRGLSSYAAVLWQAGPADYPAVSDAQRAAIDSLSEAGARLLITGHDIGFSLADAGSPAWSPAREAWFSSALKARYQADPAGWLRQVGVPGDPVTGRFDAGLPYWSFGHGRAGDFVTPAPVADGTVAPLWTTEAGPSQTNAIRWESGGPRGSSATSFWGGHTTRLLALFFEWSRLSSDSTLVTLDHDTARADVLEDALAWLLGRRAPTAALTAPLGGEIVTGDSLSIQFRASTDSSLLVARRELSYSLDGGSSWVSIDDDVADSTSFVWDLSGAGSPVPNSARVLVRLRVYDTGSPSLRAEDVTPATFAILRAGGDLQGPVMVVGSQRLSRYPIVRGPAVTLSATLSDLETGGSSVQAAEWSIGPEPAASGAGMPMAGAFDSTVVTASAEVPTGALAAGPHTLWVRGQDAAGRWGPASPIPVIANDYGVLSVSDPSFTTFLSTASPNPFRTTTRIRFGLARPGAVRLELFDMQGRRIRTLAAGVLPPGAHGASWDGRDGSGNRVRAGVYFVRLVTPSESLTSRVVSLR